MYLKKMYPKDITELLILITKLSPIILIAFSTIVLAILLWSVARGL